MPPDVFRGHPLATMNPMVSSRYPPAKWRPVSYIGEAGSLPFPCGWVLHVVVGNGSPFGTFQGAKSPNRRYSHLWVAKDGRVEQYQRLDRMSWAQASGNSSWWSVETEGFVDEPLTDAQIRALAVWHVWCGAKDAVADSTSARGIGTHSMGGAAWGGHECPGALRAAQRQQIIDRARALRSGRGDDMELTDHVDRPDDGQQITVKQAIRGAYLTSLDVRNTTDRLQRATTELLLEMDTALKRLQEIKDMIEAQGKLLDGK
jgi:hypothetical protein